MLDAAGWVLVIIESNNVFGGCQCCQMLQFSLLRSVLGVSFQINVFLSYDIV